MSYLIGDGEVKIPVCASFPRFIINNNSVAKIYQMVKITKESTIKIKNHI